jgi:hypothetical protein
MKNKILSILAMSAFLGAPAMAQETDDMYFFKKDRVTKRESVAANFITPGRALDNAEMPKFSNPDFRGGALDQGFTPTYNYYDESNNSDLSRALAQNNRMNQFNRFGGPMMMGGMGMMNPWMGGMGMMNPWMDPWMNPWMDPFMMDPFMMGAGFRPGWNMGMGWNSMWGPSMGMGFGWGNPWGMNAGFGFGGSMMMGGMWNRWGNPWMNPWMRPTVIVNQPGFVQRNTERDMAVNRTRQAIAANPRDVRSATAVPDSERRYPSRLRNYESTRNYMNNQGNIGSNNSAGRVASPSSNPYRFQNQNTRSNSNPNPSFSSPERRSSFSSPSSSPSLSRPSTPSFSTPSSGASRSIRRN